MKHIMDLVRDNIKNLKPYSCARDEFKGSARVLLDANESAYNAPFNRYPDPLNIELKRTMIKAMKRTGVSAENMFLGVGSDECIDILYRVLCRPGVDNVVAISPSYGMYGVCADINDVEYREVSLKPDTFEIDVDAIAPVCNANTKIVWICSPNNPTANSFSHSDILRLYNMVDAVVVVDEAYIDFSTQGSIVSEIENKERLVVLQTMSKAWGSAGVRLGIAFANEQLISVFNNVKYPYNISMLVSDYARKRCADYDMVLAQNEIVISERKRLETELRKNPAVEKVYPSDANFLLLKVDDANAMYRYLCDDGIVVRNRTNLPMCNNCIRITVGSPDENDVLIEALSKYSLNHKC